MTLSAQAHTTNTEFTVTVIGAGLAGLTAAWRLAQAGIPVIVLDKNTGAGGRACSHTMEGFNIDPGAGFFATFYKNTLALIDEFQLKTEIVPIHGSGAILRNGQPQRLRANLRLQATP